jgi:hypothetical protein
MDGTKRLAFSEKTDKTSQLTRFAVAPLKKTYVFIKIHNPVDNRFNRIRYDNTETNGQIRQKTDYYYYNPQHKIHLPFPTEVSA